jgi:hypothetical protein
MHKHHIIPRHEWKVRFGNLIGFNAPDNTVYLTIEQHAQAHLLLHELHGCEYDLIASQTLSGQIGKEEAYKRAVSIANTGNKYTLGLKRSEEQRLRHSVFMMGKTPWNKGKSGMYSEGYKQKISAGGMGNKNAEGLHHTEEWKKWKSLSMFGKKRGPYKKKAVI